LNIPANYLSKVLLQLCRAGILASRKGWGGGFEMAVSPCNIKISDVIKPFESSIEPRECILGKDLCGGEMPCPIHFYWKQIRNIYEMMTQRVTIADLVQAKRAGQ